MECGKGVSTADPNRPSELLLPVRLGASLATSFPSQQHSLLGGDKELWGEGIVRLTFHSGSFKALGCVSASVSEPASRTTFWLFREGLGGC